MPTKKFALADGEPERLVVKWRGRFKDFTVTLDGQRLANAVLLSDPRRLQATLPDGRPLVLSLQNLGGVVLVRVDVDGRPLPGSGFHPKQLQKQAAMPVYVVAALTFLLGVVGLMTPNIGLDPGVEFAMAALFVALGVVVQTRRSRVALGIALAVFVVDAVLTVGAGFSAGSFPLFGILIHLTLIGYLWGGFQVLAVARASESGTDAPVPA